MEFNIIIAVIAASGDVETPWYVQLHPSSWVLGPDPSEIPIIVPILFSGSDEGNSGHYSGPIILPKDNPDFFVVRLESSLQYCEGDSAFRSRCVELYRMSTMDLIKESGEVSWHGDAFPKIKRRFIFTLFLTFYFLSWFVFILPYMHYYLLQNWYYCSSNESDFRANAESSWR